MKQNKYYERDFFNQVAQAGDYDLSSDSLFAHVVKLLCKQKLSPRGNLLEAGCGTGIWGQWFLQRFSHLKITGVDISGEMIRRANENNKSKNYHAIVGDLENKNLFKSNEFDYILCVAVLHHFPCILNVVKNFNKWLKPGGMIIIIEPNGSNIVDRFSKLIRLFLQKTLGDNFIIRSGLATPNETNHTTETYRNELRRQNIDTVTVSNNYFEPGKFNLMSIGGIKLTMGRVLNFALPNNDLSTTTVVIIAKKC